MASGRAVVVEVELHPQADSRIAVAVASGRAVEEGCGLGTCRLSSRLQWPQGRAVAVEAVLCGQITT